MEDNHICYGDRVTTEIFKQKNLIEIKKIIILKQITAKKKS